MLMFFVYPELMLYIMLTQAMRLIRKLRLKLCRTRNYRDTV